MIHRLETTRPRAAGIRRSTGFLLLALFCVAPAAAQETTTEVKVIAGIVPPFVMKEGDHLTGFSIDLWTEIASRLNLKSTYDVTENVDTFFDAVRSKKAQIGVSGVFFTAARDKEFDFSYPLMEAGLQVMVRTSGAEAVPTPLRDVLGLLFSWSAAMWLGVALLIILVPAHIVWWLDRGREDGASPTRRYFPGIFHALTWATTALVSQVQVLPSQWLARVFGLIWMFAGVVFIALYTAQLTATLTAEEIQGIITGPGDLPGKRVATLRGSTAVPYLKEIGADLQEFPTLAEMTAALVGRKADAVLFGSPPLRYFAAHGGQGRVRMVGPEFNMRDIGFVFQLGDPLRRRVSSVLLTLREDGSYQRIYAKWFGGE
jgi:polar amino acid transport system substrate-binding protein